MGLSKEEEGEKENQKIERENIWQETKQKKKTNDADLAKKI